MVRISFLTTSVLIVASTFVPSIHACENECRSVPVKFLVDKYTEILQDRARSLPLGNRRHETLINRAIDRLQDVIDDSIFSRFHSNCHDKPPRRSPDEICGSAKSIACFVPWGHHHSVFDGVHAKVVHMLEETFQSKSTTEKVKQVIVEGVRDHCPGECKDWEKPFQEIMLKWEEKEHHSIYRGRVPNCLQGHLAF